MRNGPSSLRVDLIAANKTGRVGRGIKLDPLYVDVIVRRYQTATGNPVA
jgi:DNA modification methylase